MGNGEDLFEAAERCRREKGHDRTSVRDGRVEQFFAARPSRWPATVALFAAA